VRELVNLRWKSNSRNSLFFCGRIRGLVQRSNQVSFWVASKLLGHMSAPDRALLIETFISVAEVSVHATHQFLLRPRIMSC
jgi:hypothetical protein